MNRTVLILLILVLAFIAFSSFIKKKDGSDLEESLMKRFLESAGDPGQGHIGKQSGYKPEVSPISKKVVMPASGIDPKGSAKDWLRSMGGWSYEFMQTLSNSDAEIVKNYMQNYSQKGRAILPSDPMYKELVRINKFFPIYGLKNNAFSNLVTFQ